MGWLVAAIAIMWVMAYWRIPFWIWTALLALTLLVTGFTGHLTTTCLILGVIALALMLLLNCGFMRRKLITRFLFRKAQKVLPTISKTEQEALNAGDIWWEADLFRGVPNWQKLKNMPTAQLSLEEEAFLQTQVETFCSMLDDWKIVNHYRDLPPDCWEYLKKERFLGLAIDKKYGGLGFSALAQSTIVMKISSRSLSAAVTAMVPNSLGPGELLQHYGTDAQKNYYLPRLATGEEIPCFGLTAPEAGSDAAAITDSGVICKGEFEGQTIIGIRLNWNKRYITLAPVATLLGLAFKLYDPEHLLGNKTELGITVCLIPRSHPGVDMSKRHLPLTAAFFNGPTRGKDVFVPLDWIIGGKDRIGQGWRMLMECLAAGRGISLPALSTANAKLLYRTTGAYARIRQQFKVPIGHFEGIEEAMARIGGHTYMLEATRLLTAGAVSSGVRPSVVSAIAKYNMTEMSRSVVNDAMDIHGGRGIMYGPRNYVAAAYESLPVSITVEGANILTRNLIIFGQGAIRCHPYVRDEMDAIGANDLKQFDKLIFKHIGYTLTNIVRVISWHVLGSNLAKQWTPNPLQRFYRKFSRMSTAFAFIADTSLIILGGNLKRKERLSARLADVLSALYIASAVLKYYESHNRPAQDWPFVRWSLQTCLWQIQNAFEKFLNNFPNRILRGIFRLLVFPGGRLFTAPTDKLDHHIAREMMSISDFRTRLTQYCYINDSNDDVVGRMEDAFRKVIAAAHIEKKLHAAIHDGMISKKLSRAEQLVAAQGEQVLTQSEIELLQAADAARLDAITVDEFSKEELAEVHS